jgi:hypothetical protein
LLVAGDVKYALSPVLRRVWAAHAVTMRVPPAPNVSRPRPCANRSQVLERLWGQRKSGQFVGAVAAMERARGCLMSRWSMNCFKAV